MCGGLLFCLRHIPTSGEDVEQRELWDAAGENVN